MADEFCPVHAAIGVLQQKWVLHIVRELLNEPRGFNELSRSVGGCNPATLSQRLDELVTLGVVAREVHSMFPPRTMYRLTPAGVALQGVMQAVEDWGRTYIKPDPADGHACLKEQADALAMDHPA